MHNNSWRRSLLLPGVFAFVWQDQLTRAAESESPNSLAREVQHELVSQITPLPLSREDNRIRLAGYAATYGQPILNQYAVLKVPPVHIVVKNRTVVLDGTVNDRMDKTLFFTYASGVHGVISVTDHLRIET